MHDRLASSFTYCLPPISNEYEYVEIGGNIKRIAYHEPSGPGDAHYCDIYYDDGIIKRVFNPNTVTFL